MNSDNDNSIFFLTISLVCVWLIVDYVVGKQYVGKFISMLPFMGGSFVDDVRNSQIGDVQDSINSSGGNVSDDAAAYAKAHRDEIIAKMRANTEAGRDPMYGFTDIEKEAAAILATQAGQNMV